MGNPVVCTPQCSGLIADAMRAEANRHPDMYKFVVNAGDNFYPFGVHTADSWEWEGRWGKNYAGLPRMPWYSVMGNHDLSQVNCALSCGCSTCAWALSLRFASRTTLVAINPRIA